MRERAAKLLGAQGRGDAASQCAISTFHSLGLSIVREEAGALGLPRGFSILDPADLEGIVAELVATADRAARAPRQWRISAWKNALVAPADALAAAQDDAEGRRRARVPALRRRARRVSRGGLRRPDRAAVALFDRDADARARAGRRASTTCSSTSTRTPMPHSTACSGTWWARASTLHRGRRRRPGDLRLARRDAGEPRAAAPRTTRRAPGGEARAELPFLRAHPEERQRAHRQQPEAVRQAAVERARPRRRDPRAAPPATTRRKRSSSSRGCSRTGSSTAALRATTRSSIAGNHQARVFETALRAHDVP